MLSISINQVPIVSYALVQNKVDILRAITIKNKSKKNYSDLTLVIKSDPDFLDVKDEHIISLNAGDTLNITELEITFSNTYLCNLTEKVTGYTIVELVSSNGEILSTSKKEIEILDFSQFWGRMYMPQYLAAFVTPRHPAVEGVILRASEILKRWTGNASMTAYLQDVPNRPKLIMAAVYEAIKEQNITYCVPTMTLAKYGQKIRTVDELLTNERGKLGCCLDMALLYCSCLEAVGLNPLFIMQEDHAFAGAWIIPDMFEDSVNDDYTVVTKRIAEGINEIILVETTCANAGNNHSFDDAIKVANDEVKRSDKFIYVIDVVRARLAGVQPIPQRIFDGHEYEIVNPSVKRELHPQPNDVGETFDFRKNDKDGSKFDHWEKSLLDLSPRNNLLNVHFTKSTLRIMSIPLHELENRLSSGAIFHIVDRPQDWSCSISDKNLQEQISDKDPIHDLLNEEFGNDRLRSFQSESSLSKTLTNLYRTARLSLEESGANTLYLALGFLRWTEQGKMTVYHAPIILYPIKLERKSANKGYTMSSRGEDPILNETLLEYLHQNQNLEMPNFSQTAREEKGLDVKYVFAAVRKAIMEQDRWDVIDEAVLGIFDFNKFVIWNDIRRNKSSMLNNPLVKSLVDGVLSIDIEGDNKTMDLPSSDMAVPISADSSQLGAILSAAEGKSFVLHGPPGTGKSQTITNMIANALFQGKRVLFVAEKMAALEVVQRRLAEIGLAPFCLELHSNKTKKSLVMDQFKRMTEVYRMSSDGVFMKEAGMVDEIKNQLDAYVSKLHKLQRIGLSIYDCFVRYSEIQDDTQIKLDLKYISSLDAEKYSSDLEVIENFESVALVISYENPLKEIGITEYNPFKKTEISVLVGEVLQILEELMIISGEVRAELNVSKRELSELEYESLYQLILCLIERNISKSVLAHREALFTVFDEIIEAKGSLEESKKKLFDEYHEDILTISIGDLRRKWIATKLKWTLPRLVGKKRVMDTLSSFRKNENKVKEDDVLPMLDMIEKVNLCENTYRVLLTKVPECAEELSRLSLNQLVTYKKNLEAVSRALLLLSDDSLNVIEEPSMYYANSSLSEYVSLHETLKDKLAMLSEILFAHFSEGDQDWLKYLRVTLQRWNNNLGELRLQVAYNIRKTAVLNCGFNDLVKLLELNKIAPESLTKIYRKSVYRYCADYYLSLEAELTGFQGILFEEKIKKFRKICKAFEISTKRELVARLSRMIPDFQSEAASGSDVGILQKCIRNNCRGMSVRKLFSTIPGLLSRMCPAMLMSPLSVSQYLDNNWPEFDLVVFDEASQMPTCEAVAAISRAKSAIIVGDEHQLPPTNFFVASSYSEQHSEVNDLESILDDCLALSIPQKYLRWHYRSRHESLIAFSNRYFYKNALMTFPSNDDISKKVSFCLVDGVYERGHGRYNKEEAKAVVAEVRRCLESEADRYKSIGVVTFNVNQQSLIEDMLNDLFKKYPHLEQVASGHKEHIFVKNLENVQGDERDIIIFSVGYGKDRNGMIAMNFGPLNRDGGERRLNVAVSRARCEMKIFSSLKSEDIDIYRSNAKGVLYLKAFLEYAESGTMMNDFSTHRIIKKDKDAFVESVALALKKNGFEVNTDIGCSDYRIDIGIIDPDDIQKYLLGIICDGYNYVMSSSVRDRDITAPFVLEQLGWKIMNIWSIEWWDTPQLVISQIIKVINSVKASDVDDDNISEKEEGLGATSLKEESISLIKEEKYLNADFCTHKIDPASLIGGEYKDSIVFAIQKIIDVEAPISKRLLVKKILKAYGISRNGVRLSSYLDSVFEGIGLYLIKHGEDVFYWKNKEQVELYYTYRKAEGRDVRDIAPEEVVNASVHVLKEHYAMSKETLIIETAYLLGFPNMRDNVAIYMKRGIDLGISKGMYEMDGKRLKLLRRNDLY